MAEFHNLLASSLPGILTNIPSDWRGTTFKNSNLLGRKKFSENLLDLLRRKGGIVTQQDLIDLGNAGNIYSILVI